MTAATVADPQIGENETHDVEVPAFDEPRSPQGLSYARGHKWWGPQGLNPFLKFVPPGHFYSPIPGDKDIQRRELVAGAIRDIELNDEAQRRLLLDLSRYYGELPFKDAKEPDRRYYFDQPWYAMQMPSISTP